VIADDDGYEERGLIIRHLVLPNNIENSKSVLKFIAEEISTSVKISLMSQFYPANRCNVYQEINRFLSKDEYQEIIDEMQNLGLYKGYFQELESNQNYQPNFKNKHPFE